MWTYCTVFLLSRVVESLHQGWANRSSTSSRDLPLLSGRKRKKNSQPRADTPAYSQKVPYLVIASVRVRKLMDTRRLKAQLMEVAREKQVERAHSG
uniref:Secreted protein n=1 Tax=Ixodes ricinus TaxID=34613 RepID=A0A6B0UA18_IXORI